MEGCKNLPRKEEIGATGKKKEIEYIFRPWWSVSMLSQLLGTVTEQILSTCNLITYSIRLLSSSR